MTRCFVSDSKIRAGMGILGAEIPSAFVRGSLDPRFREPYPRTFRQSRKSATVPICQGSLLQCSRILSESGREATEDRTSPEHSSTLFRKLNGTRETAARPRHGPTHPKPGF